jgi:hypothetical protein
MNQLNEVNMKIILTIAVGLLSFSAIAGFNEIECEGNNGLTNVYLEIEQPFPNTSVFKRMLLSASTASTQENFQYTVTSNRYNGFRNIVYQGSRLRLDVDLWPDFEPRWGRNYRAILSSSDINNGINSILNCYFPNAN